MMKRILSRLNVVAAVVLAFVLVQMVSFFALRNPVRFDLSDRQYYRLSEKTLQLLRTLDQRVDVIVFFQEEHALYHDIENLLEEYTYQSRNIHVEWVDPLRDPARTEKLADKYKLSDAQVVVFASGDRSRIVRQSDIADSTMVEGRRLPVISNFKGEQAFSSAIQGLVQGQSPVAYFLVGHGEHRVAGETGFDQRTGFSNIASIMARDNIEVRELMLTGEKRIPVDASALVIAGPSKEMTATEAEIVGEYLSRSGRVMLMVDALKKTGLETMLRQWGVALRDDIVVDPANTLKGNDVYVRTYYEHPITLRMGDAGARFYLPRSVEPLAVENGSAATEDRPTVTRLAVTSDKSWSETQFDQNPKFDPNTGDVKGPCSLAVAVERGASQKQLDVQIKPSRMVVFGDSDFVCNGALAGGNQDLFMSAMNWLLDRDALMAIAPKPAEQMKLNLTRKQLTRVFWLNVAGIPAVAVAAGLLVWLRRRK